jgi:hypothetical protein
VTILFSKLEKKLTFELFCFVKTKDKENKNPCKQKQKIDTTLSSMFFFQHIFSSFSNNGIFFVFSSILQLILIFLGKKSPNFQYHQDEIKIHEIRATYYQKLFHIFIEKALQMLKKDISNLVTHNVFFSDKICCF